MRNLSGFFQHGWRSAALANSYLQVVSDTIDSGGRLSPRFPFRVSLIPKRLRATP
jgi:hypothetical protein